MIDRAPRDIHQFNIPKERSYIPYAVVAAGSLAASLVFAEVSREDPKYSIDNKAEQSNTMTVEYDDDTESTPSGPAEIYEFIQDQPTSITVQNSVLDFIKKYGVEVKDGQSAVIYESSVNIDEIVELETGGAVQDGMQFITRLDLETGYVVSEYLPDESK